MPLKVASSAASLVSAARDTWQSKNREIANAHFGERQRLNPLWLFLLFGAALWGLTSNRSPKPEDSVSEALESLYFKQDLKEDSLTNWVYDPEFDDYLVDFCKKANIYLPAAELFAFYKETRFKTGETRGTYFSIHQIEEAQFQQFVLDDPKGVSKILFGDPDNIDREQLGWQHGRPPSKAIKIRKPNKNQQLATEQQRQYLSQITKSYQHANPIAQFEIFGNYYIPKHYKANKIEGCYSLAETYALKLWPRFVRQAQLFRENEAPKYKDRDLLLEAFENLVVVNGDIAVPPKPSSRASKQAWSRYNKAVAERNAYRANAKNLDFDRHLAGNRKITVRDLHQELVSESMRPLSLKLKDYRALFQQYRTQSEHFWGDATLRYDAAQAFRFADEDYFAQTGKHIPITMAYCHYEVSDKNGDRPPYKAVQKHASGDCVQIPQQANDWRLAKVLKKYGFIKKEMTVTQYGKNTQVVWPYYQYGGIDEVSWWVDGDKKRKLEAMDFQVVDWKAFMLPHSPGQGRRAVN